MVSHLYHRGPNIHEHEHMERQEQLCSYHPIIFRDRQDSIAQRLMKVSAAKPLC